MDKETEQILNQAQIYQQQIQTVIAQKSALNLEIREIKNALEEIGKTRGESVFKISGPIMIKVDTKEIEKELKEKEDMLSLRLKTIEKQERKLKEKIEELRSKLMKSRSNAG